MQTASLTVTGLALYGSNSIRANPGNAPAITPCLIAFHNTTTNPHGGDANFRRGESDPASTSSLSMSIKSKPPPGRQFTSPRTEDPNHFFASLSRAQSHRHLHYLSRRSPTPKWGGRAVPWARPADTLTTRTGGGRWQTISSRHRPQFSLWTVQRAGGWKSTGQQSADLVLRCQGKQFTTDYPALDAVQ